MYFLVEQLIVKLSWVRREDLSKSCSLQGRRRRGGGGVGRLRGVEKHWG